MSIFCGENIKLQIFGQSHSDAIGMTLSGMPAGIAIDFDTLQAFLDRRAPGRSALTTSRREADIPEFVSGLKDGVTCGGPVTAMIRNTDTRSGDYDQIKDVPRPGHADYTAHVKYGGCEDYRGGGSFSGRMTAPLCAAGGIALQILEKRGITVTSEIVAIGGRTDRFAETVEAAKADGDSVGGLVRCKAGGVPCGLGGPLFEGAEGRIAELVFAIPAVKGIEFGAGFASAAMRGSENNDAFAYDENGKVVTLTNNCGGILGGITDGMDVVFTVALKPTPSIAKEQRSISYSKRENVTMTVKGRHDPCIVLRAQPCVESAAALAILDMAGWKDDD